MEGGKIMYLISRLWIDPDMNQNAYGYEPIGIVNTREEAERISESEWILKLKQPWPLKYAYEFDGDSVPVFISKELPDITGQGVETLKKGL